MRLLAAILSSGRVGVEQAGTGFGDLVDDGGFLFGVGLDGGDQIGDQIGAALQVGVDLRPIRIDGFALGGEVIADADELSADHEDRHNRTTIRTIKPAFMHLLSYCRQLAVARPSTACR